MTTAAAPSVSLPEAAALEAALAAGNAEECQRLMLAALYHGTGYFDNINDDAVKEDPSPLSTYIEATVKWFEVSFSQIHENSALASSLEIIEDALVDCLWLLGSTLTSIPWSGPSEASGGSVSESAQIFHPSVRALVVIVRALLSASFWKDASSIRFARKLQENWFPNLLEQIDIIKVTAVNSEKGTRGNADDLMKRLRQYNTAANYKLQKYNLLQEESEGYSKILQYLSNGFNSENKNTHNRSFLWQLVGTFELDPNRVLDLALDVLEFKLKVEQKQTNSPPATTDEIRWLLNVMKDCSTDKLPALLRFKLNRANQGTAQDSSFLMETIAVLVREEALDLKVFIEDYFDSTLKSNIENAYGIFRKKERDRVMALSRVSLSGNTSNKENPKQIELGNKLKVAMGKLNVLDRSSVTINKKNADIVGKETDDSDGQILSLLQVLIRWGEWERVKPLLSSSTSSSYSLSAPPMSLWSKLCCLMPEKFGSVVLDVTEARIQEVSIGTRSIAPKLNNTNFISSDANESDSEPRTVSTMTDLVHLVRSISGPLSCIVPSGCIKTRPVLYCNLCRLLKSILTNIVEESKTSILSSVPQEIFSFFESFLVPSLSLFPSNPAISTELWSVLTLLPYDIRYKLYESWKGSGLEKAGLVGGGTKPLPNVEAEMVAGKAARYSLKRLSKDNIRDMSRQLAKVTHSNPLVVFATILSQIESYDNMVEVMVEAQRFVNPLGLDVLGHCILGRLSGTSGGVNRSRLKEDGVHVSQWLQSLETFAGEFYKTRPSVEFRGILSYLMERLKDGNVMELGILRTLLKVAGGYSFADYSPAASLNENQLDGRSGSLTLKRETMSFGIVEKTNPLAIDHVRSVLQADGLGVSLLILIAQARDRMIFDSGKGAFKEVKLVGNLYDTCQVVMAILLEFLTNDENTNSDDVDGEQLGQISLYSKFLPSFQDLQRKHGLDMGTAWHLCRPCVKAALQMKPENLERLNLSLFELSEDVRQAYSDALPEPVWNLLTPKLFEFFYMTSLSDISCPVGVFDSEINRIDKEIERINGLKTPSRDESRELERLKSVSKQLSKDMKMQNDHVETTLKELNEDKTEFFVSEEISKEAARAFLMHCTFPRTTQSPDDAMYSATIAFRLHKIWTPGFSIMHYLDELNSIVSGALFGVTEAEAANLAILLWQTLKIVNTWRHEDGIYDKEVLGKPGSYMEISDGEETSTDPVSRKDFIELYNKWQYSLADALIGCLKSSEYIHIRAGLVVLSRLVNVFPTGPSVGNKILKVLEPLQDESSSRPDIRASANSYGMMLVKARDEGKWVEEDESAAKARAQKEKEAAEERKKKIEQSFKELERDNEKITAQIGTDDRRDRDRSRGGPRDGREPPSGSRNTSDYSRMENGRDRRGDDRDRRDSDRDRDRDRRGDDRDRRGDDRDRRGDDRDRRTGRDRDRDVDMKDDRGRGGRHDDRRGGTRDGGGDQNQRGGRDDGRDDGRWRRGDGPARNPKRGRPLTPPPGDDRDRDGDRSAKRPRNDDYYPSRRSGPSRGRR